MEAKIFVAVRHRFIELYLHTFLLARLPLVSLDANLLGLLLISALFSYMEDESSRFAGHLQGGENGYSNANITNVDIT